jgi:uncharacterized protein YyaL (SSP411 family)
MAKVKAKLLFNNILTHHYREGIVHHSSYDGKRQPGEFLEDYAALLLLATYLYEDTGEHKDLIATLYAQLQKFHQGQWIESKTSDFREIPAQRYDHPTPSSASLAAIAKLRAEIILGKEYTRAEYKQPLQYDFYNLMVFMSKGQGHIIHVPHKIEWKHLPANSMQISGNTIQDCYQQKCVEYKDITQLLAGLGKN